MKNSSQCYHCGLPFKGEVFYTHIAGINQPMCCIGCQAVSQAIVDNDLVNYYSYRDQNSISQRDIIPPELNDFRQYDLPAIQSKFFTSNAQTEFTKEMILSIEGITCAACVWVLEKRMAMVKGVTSFSINLANHRAKIAWEDNVIELSQILMEIAKIGFRAQPFELQREEAYRRGEQKKALKSLAISGLGFGQVMMFAAPLYDWFSGGIPDYYRDFFRLVSLIVTTPVLIYCGFPFFKSAWQSLKSRILTMDVSISFALITVFIAGVYATVMRSGEVYFDSITMFLFFITLTRYLEMRSRNQSSFIVQKIGVKSQDWVLMKDGEKTSIVPLQDVKSDDVIIIKSGATFPVDGVVIEGESSVNESLLTGESLPKLKTKNDLVIAGSVNIDNPLTMRVGNVGDKTVLATIMRLYDRAQFEKPKIVSVTQRFSHYFILTQLALAFFLFAAWSFVSVAQGFWVVISLLVISCPCALALATPIAFTVSMNAFSRIGFLCTRGHVLDGLVKPTDIVFDKTGTLTEGKFRIQQVSTFDSYDINEVTKIAAALEHTSEHPLASAFKYVDISVFADQVKLHPNLGVEGYIEGKQYFLGNLAFIKTKLSDLDDYPVINEHSTQIILANTEKVMAIFSLVDQLRPHARQLIDYFYSRGFRVHLVSGDNHATVNYYANLLGIHLFKAECSPEDKLAYVKALQAKDAHVVMFGDGLNDAPVLMQSQLSIAMTDAADITRISSDAVLMKNDMSLLISVFEHAFKANRVIKQCLIFSLIYNLLTIPLAISGLVPPYVAAALMSISSLIVVLNALRLVRLAARKENREYVGESLALVS